MKRITLTLFTALMTSVTSASDTKVTTQVDVPNSQQETQLKTSALNTESKIPNVDFSSVDKKVALPAKKWEHALPFFAEDVIMNGYDLPLPFGISIIYANVQQDMTLTDLSVGYGGGQKYDIDFVSFDNTESNTHTPQLKLDAWVFPFMNVFATVGKLTGTVGINFAIDGDDALEQGNVDCTLPKNRPLCNALGGASLEVEDIEANLTGMSYGAGMMFVGGWNSYFISVPVTFTWTDMDRSDTDGYVVNVLPRVGKQFQFNNGSSLSLYVGTSYLKSQLTLSGTQHFTALTENGKQVEGSIDYKVEQENVDKWMGLVGGSYNLSKHWMVAFEYGGIGGASRQQFITNLSYRY